MSLACWGPIMARGRLLRPSALHRQIARMQVLPRARLECCVVVAIAWCALVTFLFIQFGDDQVHSKALQETNKCPVCFGHTSCFMLHSNNMHVVKLTGLSKVSLFNYINVKNVFFGKYKGDEIVLKKLAHDSELAEFDRRVCNGTARCAPRGRLFSRLLRAVFPDFAGGRSESLALAAGIGDRFLREHLTCPSARLQRRLFDALTDDSRDKFFHFATMLLINAEPLLLQVCVCVSVWKSGSHLI